MTFLLFLLILSILVFVHELGHFLAAKRAGIKVEEFGFGLPPKLWGKKIGETTYSVNALPIGGFVKLYGEDGAGEMTNNQIPSTKQFQNTKYKIQNAGRAYFEKSIPRRLSVLLAGVAMNLFLAIICFSILYFIWGIPTRTKKIKVEGVLENSPAQLAGLRENDIVLSVDGEKIIESKNLIELASQKAGNKIRLEIFREKDNPCENGSDKVMGGIALEGVFESYCKGKNLVTSLIPRQNPPEGEGPLGIVITDTEFRKYPWYKMPFLGVREGFKESISWGKMVMDSLGKMILGLLAGKIPKDVAGPIGIYQITASAAKVGWMAVLQFIGILSVNLAIINILPIPAMDGGRIIFLVYEAIFRKKAPSKIEMAVNQIGIILLISLMALITINDVVRLVGK